MSENVFNSMDFLTDMNIDEDDKNELKQYLADDTVKCDNLIKWWISKSLVYPLFLHMVLDYLTIPGRQCSNLSLLMI